MLGEDDPEYLLWLLSRNPADATATPAFRHVGVNNTTRHFKEASLTDPPYILTTHPIASGTQIGFSTYEVEAVGQGLALYRRAEKATAPSVLDPGPDAGLDGQ